MRIGIVAGELSGDQLGAGLIRALRARYPHATFEGVGGPKMIAEGFTSHYPIDRLAVMGLVEPLKRLPELLSMRRWLKRHFLAVRPRSEEHTSELQSRGHLVCRLVLEK